MSFTGPNCKSFRAFLCFIPIKSVFMRYVLLVVVIMVLASCNSEKKGPAEIRTGIWRGVVEMQGRELPFNFELINTKGGGYHVYILNASERLRLDDVTVTGDTIDMGLHIFDANLKANVSPDGKTMTGSFLKNYDRGFRLPFKAEFGKSYRFEKGAEQSNVPDFTGKYRVVFTDETDTTEAIGVFTQQGDSVTGTFLTPTGDYRYLQGNVVDGQMQLSTFDGNHAYIFTAKKDEAGNLAGEHISGKSYKAQWTGIKDENASLPDPESLTYLKPGFEKIEFRFPDVNGKTISLSDQKYQGKVVILQLFGTWCPNCMDETKFLAPWYKENKDRGVEIIGLAYERKDDFTYASERVKNMIAKLDVTYDFAIAGTNDKEKAAQTLPMLNKVVAFPTTIFIGKDGKVKSIHTGFSGPGTGKYYEQFVEQFNQKINELLSETLASKK